MKITKFCLTIENEESRKLLIYHGNENIIIRQIDDEEKGTKIIISRFILQKFLELIE